MDVRIHIPLLVGNVALLVGDVPLLVGDVPLVVGGVPLLVGDIPLSRQVECNEKVNNLYNKGILNYPL